MENNFTDLLRDNLNDIAIDFAALKKDSSKSIIDYVKFLELLIITDDSEKLPDTKIKLSQLKENNFLDNFIEAFSIAPFDKDSEDEFINEIANSLRTLVNNGYLNKDIQSIKLDLPIQGGIVNLF